MVVGFLAAVLGRVGFDLEGAETFAFVEGIVSVAYYALARFLEAHVSPAWGRALGKATNPEYSSTLPAVVVSIIRVPTAYLAGYVAAIVSGVDAETLAGLLMIGGTTLYYVLAERFPLMLVIPKAPIGSTGMGRR